MPEGTCDDDTDTDGGDPFDERVTPEDDASDAEEYED